MRSTWAARRRRRPVRRRRLRACAAAGYLRTAGCCPMISRCGVHGRRWRRRRTRPADVAAIATSVSTRPARSDCSGCWNREEGRGRMTMKTTAMRMSITTVTTRKGRSTRKEKKKKSKTQLPVSWSETEPSPRKIDIATSSTKTSQSVWCSPPRRFCNSSATRLLVQSPTGLDSSYD